MNNSQLGFDFGTNEFQTIAEKKAKERAEKEALLKAEEERKQKEKEKIEALKKAEEEKKRKEAELIALRKQLKNELTELIEFNSKPAEKVKEQEVPDEEGTDEVEESDGEEDE